MQKSFRNTFPPSSKEWLASGASFFSNSGAAEASENMACDAELLHLAEKSRAALFFRVYSWKGPSISFGRSQKARQLLNEKAFQHIAEAKLQIAERPSGGRALLHFQELSYAIASSQQHPILGGHLKESLLAIAKFLRDFLISLGIPEEILQIQETTKNSRAVDCRAMHGYAEILLDGKKLIGSAQRRSRYAFMQHGSIPVARHTRSLQEYLVEEYQEKPADSFAESKEYETPFLENFIQVPEHSDPLVFLASKFTSFAEKTLS